VEALLSALIDRWLDQTDPVSVIDKASISSVRDAIRMETVRTGLPSEVTDPVLVAATELASNQLHHAGRGHFACRGIERNGVLGIELIAADRGDGIADPSAAINGLSRTPAGLGVGLGGVLRMMDEVDIDIRIGEGTCIWARKFVRRLPRQRQIGIFGYPHPNEALAGDDAWFRREGDKLWLAVADGLGHGPEARRAAQSAVHALKLVPSSPHELLIDRNLALRSTRGATLAVIAVDDSQGELEAAVAGNVTVGVWGPSGTQRIGGTSFTLGSNSGAPKPRSERALVRSWDSIIAFTDGVSSRARMPADVDLMTAHPIGVAEAIARDFGVKHDDALVLVAR
jgi:anti-sigma regulatory factor (Ser/Thr protein kinase)